MEESGYVAYQLGRFISLKLFNSFLQNEQSNINEDFSLSSSFESGEP